MKIKHKFNWFDVLIILAVIIVAIGVFWRMTGQVQSATATSTAFSYTVKVQEIRQYSVDALNKSVGCKFNMNAPGRTDDMGVLQSVDARPASKEIDMMNGTAVAGDIPDRFDVTLTFRLNGVVNSLGYYTPQLSNIGAGASVIIKSKYVQVQGSVGAVTSE